MSSPLAGSDHLDISSGFRGPAMHGVSERLVYRVASVVVYAVTYCRAGRESGSSPDHTLA